MNRMTAKDFDQGLLELYDFYAHGKITKREFLDRAGKYAVGGLTAMAILNMLSPNYAMAEQVPFTDPDIKPEYITYPSPNGHGDVRGYMVTPTAATAPVGGVVVVHENRGLNPYIEDVARRVAKAGFVALAPDGLTSVGGYPGNDEEGRELQSSVDGDQADERLLRRRGTPDGPRGGERQGRHRRLLLWRRGLQRRRRGVPRACRLGAVLRPAGCGRGCAEDPGTASVALCRPR